jgi:hypothetical protein
VPDGGPQAGSGRIRRPGLFEGEAGQRDDSGDDLLGGLIEGVAADGEDPAQAAGRAEGLQGERLLPEVSAFPDFPDFPEFPDFPALADFPEFHGAPGAPTRAQERLGGGGEGGTRVRIEGVGREDPVDGSGRADEGDGVAELAGEFREG